MPRQLPASQTELHNKSLRNLNNSRSLFEQQLEQHQQLLMEHQQQTLANFNNAIRKEIDEDRRVQGVDSYFSDEGRLSHSASLSSLDSLEEQDNSKNNVINEMKEHMDSVSKTQNRNDKNTSGDVPLYQPHPPAKPPPQNISPRSQALLQHTGGHSAVPVTIASYSGAIPRPVMPTPSAPVSNVAVPRYNSPLQRSHSSPTIAVVQPNNAQVSDDMELPTRRYNEKPIADNNNHNDLKASNATDNMKKELVSQDSHHSYLSETSSAQSLQKYETVPSNMHNQTYTVAMATVAQPYTATAYSISKSNSEISNKEGATPYKQTGTWMNNPDDYKVNSYTSKVHIGTSNVNCTAEMYAAPYMTSSNVHQENNKFKELNHSTYGVTPPSTQNLLNAIETMTSSTPKQQEGENQQAKVNTNSQGEWSQEQPQQAERSGWKHNVKSNQDAKTLDVEDDDSETGSSEEENKENKAKKKEIKGILKKNPGVRGRNLGVKGQRVNISTGASVRDSLEITREHQHRPKAPLKVKLFSQKTPNVN